MEQNNQEIMQQLENTTFNGKKVVLKELTLSLALKIIELLNPIMEKEINLNEFISKMLKDKLCYRLFELVYQNDDGTDLIIDDNIDIGLDEATTLLTSYIVKKNMSLINITLCCRTLKGDKV